MRTLEVVLSIATVATLLGSVAVVGRHRGSARRWRDLARARLVWGIPWGSVVVIGVVLCVYLFVQDGITDFENPVVIPYRAYSYFYPLGMLAAPFSHAGPGHLVGNLSGTLVVAPIAEYAWGHYPDERAARSGSRLRTDPRLRALVVFPLAVIAVGIVSSLFALGPVIGFSGVVFAFAAFALVHYPIATLVGVLGVQGLLLTVYRALRAPIQVYVAEPRPPAAPSWAGIAIQGHALGFFVGLVLAIALLRRRNHSPDALRVWLAVLLFAVAKGLWQIYWFGSENRYVLFRGPGVLVVAALALVIAVAVAGDDRSLLPRRVGRLIGRARGSGGATPGSTADRPLERIRNAGPHRSAGTRLERIADIAGGSRSPKPTRPSAPGPSQRRVAFATVVLVLAVVAGMAVPANFFVLGDPAVAAGSDSAVEIGDYTVGYAEGVENELTSPVEVGPLADAVTIESSGVIVTSERRQLWSEVVPARQLAFTGNESIAVGGPGWRETVHVERTGWEPVGNDTVYLVEIWPAGEQPRVAYESNASRADVRIDDRTVTVAAERGEFRLEVDPPGPETASTTLPAEGEPTAAGGLTFERQNATVYAVSNGTEVAVATEETYP